MKRTPWFSGFEHPVREGVYERKLYNYHNGEELLVYSYWDGQQWFIGASSPEDAMRTAENLGPTMTLHREWRGLLKEDEDEDRSYTRKCYERDGRGRHGISRGRERGSDKH